MTNRRPRIKIEPRPATRALPRQPATPIATPTAPADRAEPAVLAEVEVAVTPLEGDQLPNGLPLIGDNGGGGDVDNLLSNVVQTVGAIGSSSPLNDIVNGHGLFDPLGGALGGTLDGTLGGTGIGDVVSNLGNAVVSDLGQTAGAVTKGGGIDGVLGAVGSGAGNLVDGVLNAVDGATGTGLIGSVLDGLGDNVVNGAVGGAGLLAGTPLAGLQGDGALVSSNILNGGDSSSPSSLIQVGAGTDQSSGLINVDAASNRDTSESNNMVDTNVGPQSSGNGVTADLLGANNDSSGALIDGDIGQHDGPSLVGVNAGTAADQFQFPALDGTGLDSLVGEVGQLPGNPIGDVGGGDLLPVSAGLDGHALLDVGTDGTLGLGDNSVNTDGTQIMVNTPLHGALAA
jgi:hypothetical protein